MTTQEAPAINEVSVARRSVAIPYRACALIGLGGLFAGVTGPLLSTFIPPLVRDAVGEQRTLTSPHVGQAEPTPVRTT